VRNRPEPAAAAGAGIAPGGSAQNVALTCPCTPPASAPQLKKSDTPKRADPDPPKRVERAPAKRARGRDYDDDDRPPPRRARVRDYDNEPTGGYGGGGYGGGGYGGRRGGY